MGITYPKFEVKTKCEITNNYFNDNPDKLDSVVRATFAYQFYHFRQHPGAHKFDGPWKDCRCEWCGMSREEVRWCDDLPYECQKRPENTKGDVVQHIQEVLKYEEELNTSNLKKGEKIIPKYIEKHGLNGESLAILHHTYGLNLDVVGSYYDITEEMEKEYEQYMQEEKERSRTDNKIKKKVINIKYERTK